MSWSNWDSGGGGKAATQERRRIGPLGAGSGFQWGGGPRRPQGNPFANATVSNVTRNVQSPPTPEFGTGNWYETPGMRFNNYGQAWDSSVGVYRNVQAPEWMGDPVTFYGTYHSAPEDYRAAMIANMQSDYENRRLTQEALDRGRGYLTGQQNRVNQAAGNWADDPYRALVMDSLSQRAGPDYEFFTPNMRTAYLQPVGQTYARNQAMMQADQASRGTYSGGGAIEDSAALRSLAQSGGNRIQAQIDESEQRLKNEALSALAGTTAQYNAADAAYVNAGNQLAGALASLESGVDYEPTDFTVWPALNDATQRAEDEARFRDESLRLMEEEAKFKLDDLAELVLSSIGTGLWDFVL